MFLVQLGNRLKLKVKKLLTQLDQSKCNHNDHMICEQFETGSKASVCKPQNVPHIVRTHCNSFFYSRHIDKSNVVQEKAFFSILELNGMKLSSAD